MISRLKIFFIFLTVALALLAVTLVKVVVGGFYIVSSNGMEPLLKENSFVFVNKIAGFGGPVSQARFKPQRGDVVLARFPNGEKTFKRIIALPGDLVEFKGNHLYLNGHLRTFSPQKWTQAHPLFKKTATIKTSISRFLHGGSYQVLWEKLPFKAAYPVLVKQYNFKNAFSNPPRLIPKGHYFLAGDNRSHSHDSRFYAADLKTAGGLVTFSKIRPNTVAFIPAGTILYGKNQFLKMELFQTTRDHKISGLFKDIEVEALNPGLNGNILSGQILAIKGALSQDFQVANIKGFSGGQNNSLVPLENLLGRIYLLKPQDKGI